MWAEQISLFIGIWLIISGLIPNLQIPANLVIFGILGKVFGFFFIFGWKGVVTEILGISLILCGLISSFINIPNIIHSGIILLVVSLIYMYHQHSEVERAYKTARI